MEKIRSFKDDYESLVAAMEESPPPEGYIFELSYDSQNYIIVELRKKLFGSFSRLINYAVVDGGGAYKGESIKIAVNELLKDNVK